MVCHLLSGLDGHQLCEGGPFQIFGPASKASLLSHLFSFLGYFLLIKKMRCELVTKSGPLCLLLLAGTCSATSENFSSCRNIPGDTNWPTDSEWTQLNGTVGGRLIATVPLASVCHASPFDNFDETACTNLKADWDYAETQ